LFDREKDVVITGDCCKNVKLVEYPGCKGDSCPKSSVNNPNANVPSEIAANYCLEITKSDYYTWRICSDSMVAVTKLQTKLNINIVASQSPKGKIDATVMEKLMLKLSEKRVSAERRLRNWHWDDQKTWEGFCREKKTFQSPIAIESSIPIKAENSDMKFGVDYTFDEVNTLVKKHYQELKVHFLNAAGVLKYWVDNQNLIFQPQYLSFRFPGEHVIDGKRYPGEVLIHFTELNPNRKTWITNGLVLSIPLNPKKDHPNLKIFDDLNPDFWKLGVKKTGQYEPKQTLGKKLLKFNLSELVKKSVIQNPKYFTYVGSQTTPPCNLNVIYLILNKPIKISNCQFKVIRESSLLTDRPKEIHARLTQNRNGRKVYELGAYQMKFSPQIKSIIPMMVKKFKAYEKAIRKMIGSTKPKVIQSCGVIKGLSKMVIKKPLKPKNLKELNARIKRINKMTMKAMKMKGKQGKIARQQALARVKAEIGDTSCDTI
jgi:carbonic anhydrase